MAGPANLRDDAFAGTAEAYARFRAPYPDALLDSLKPRSRRGRLLDLACGPGRVAIPLASGFDSVWAIDLEPQMIEVGRREAGRRGAHNVAWIVGPAEGLEAPAGAFDLVTIGEAFHRLDQARIAGLILGWLRPGGRLATLGVRGILGGPEPWQAAVTALAREWTASAFPDGWASARPGAAATPAAQEGVLREAGFVDVESREYAVPRAWTFEEILGYLQSTSVCSKRILADRFEAFAAALGEELAPHAADGLWRETLACGLTLARKA